MFGKTMFGKTMFGKHPFGKTVYGTTFKDIPFVPLQSATFCVQCELISTNSKPYCLACGSHALLGLSRVLGGSLRHQQTAHLINDVELDNLVRDLLRSVPEPQLLSLAADRMADDRMADRWADNSFSGHSSADRSLADRSRMSSLAQRSQLRVANAAHPISGFRAVAL